MNRIRPGVMLLISFILSLEACSKKEEKAAEEAAGSPAQTVLPVSVDLPETAIGYLLAGNPSAMLGRLEKLAGKVSPVPPGFMNALILQGLRQMGMQDTSVLDLNGPAGILVLDPKKYQQPAIFACTVKGEDQVLKSLKPAWRDVAVKDGIHRVVREEVDTYGVFKGGGKETPTVSETLFLKFAGKTLLVASQAEAIQVVASVLEQQLQAGIPAGTVVGTLRMDHLRKIFQPELSAVPLSINQAFSRDASLAQFPEPEKMKWLLGWMVEKLMNLIQQTKAVSFSLDLPEDAAVFRLGLHPEKDTFFAKLLAAQKPGLGTPLGLVDALPAGNFLVMGVNVQWEPFKEDLLTFTKEIIKALLGKEPSKEYQLAMSEMWEILGDDVVVSENISGDGISIAEVFTVKDEARARTVFNKVLALTSELFSGKDGLMGMKFGFEGPKELGDHHGVLLQGFDMTWEWPSMPAGQANLLKQLYGEKLRMVAAVFNKQYALTIGKTAEQKMKELIDRVEKKDKGLTTSPAFTSAAGGLEKDSGGFLFMSISQLIQSSIESTFAALGGPAPAIKLTSSESGLFIAFKSTPEWLMTTVRLPANHLEEIGGVFKALQQAATNPTQ